jgi:hypothetical protein
LQFSAHGTRRVDENLLRLRHRQQKQPGVRDGGGEENLNLRKFNPLRKIYE